MNRRGDGVQGVMLQAPRPTEFFFLLAPVGTMSMSPVACASCRCPAVSFLVYMLLHRRGAVVRPDVPPWAQLLPSGRSDGGRGTRLCRQPHRIEFLTCHILLV